MNWLTGLPIKLIYVRRVDVAQMRNLRALLVAATVVLAGCIGAGDDESLDDADPTLATITDPMFGLNGTVTDPSGLPIADVHVTIRTGVNEVPLTTDANGFFTWGEFGNGPALLLVTYNHTDFVQTTRQFNVTSTNWGDGSVVLQPLGSGGPVPDLVVLQPINGHYDCAMESVILTGDCMVLWEEYVSEEDPVTVEVNHFLFDAEPGWTHVVVELTWTTGANNQLDGMHLYLAPAEESVDPSEHHTKMAVAEGAEQPLRIQMDAGQLHETAERYPDNDTYAQLAPGGGGVLGLAYPRGKLAQSMGGVCEPENPDRCFLGVGVGADIQFTAYVAIFYSWVDGVDPAFTMVPP